ncbi:class I SAM-dependent methyltransferase [Roseomonas eburnea]|uniref:Class I SAM-dependent methyltransferase n=1 Tax=Neoroseomonas eburnea TaxID=1346889 RepID=A0A9X9XBA3_9PROT|nr:class I SAM-dependent methyltransferase [Neoroseomonas eburnea]MBR0680989.1 class I SAM-dependent methyltransferase [Neoroseomonas eburnea]
MGRLPWWFSPAGRRQRREAARRREAQDLLDLLAGDAEFAPRLHALVVEAIGHRLASPNDAEGRPHLDPLSLALRELPNTVLNVKTLAADLARRQAERLPAVPPPAAPRRIRLTSRVCRQADMEQPWMAHWREALGARLSYHRKAWEYGFILQALWEAGMLAPGKRGVGFAVGQEPLPSFLAARGVEVLATDLDSADGRAAAWAATRQNAARLDDLHHARLVDRETFLARCSFRPVDMNHVPADLAGGFDFVWSSCSFEHLGSIEQGLAFVEATMACLKPGGIAVHTTEYRFSEDGPKLDNWPCVAFSWQDMKMLAGRLAVRGHRMLPIEEAAGRLPLDGYIDTPPYAPMSGKGLALPAPPHLRVSVEGIPATSLGIIVQAGPAGPSVASP